MNEYQNLSIRKTWAPDRQKPGGRISQIPMSKNEVWAYLFDLIRSESENKAVGDSIPQQKAEDSSRALSFHIDAKPTISWNPSTAVDRRVVHDLDRVIVVSQRDQEKRRQVTCGTTWVTSVTWDSNAKTICWTCPIRKIEKRRGSKGPAGVVIWASPMWHVSQLWGTLEANPNKRKQTKLEFTADRVGAHEQWNTDLQQVHFTNENTAPIQ